MRTRNLGRRLVVAVPLVWLLLFFMVPFILVFGISFSQAQLSIPPFAPLWEWVDHRVLALRVHLANYQFLATDALYISSYLYSLKVAAISTLFCLLLGYPMAYGIARAAPGSADNWAHGVVQEVAYLGDTSVYLLRLDGGREVRVTQANRTRKPEEQFKWDEAVYLSWDAASPVVGMG